MIASSTFLWLCFLSKANKRFQLSSCVFTTFFGSFIIPTRLIWLSFNKHFQRKISQFRNGMCWTWKTWRKSWKVVTSFICTTVTNNCEFSHISTFSLQLQVNFNVLPYKIHTRRCQLLRNANSSSLFVILFPRDCSRIEEIPFFVQFSFSLTYISTQVYLWKVSLRRDNEKVHLEVDGKFISFLTRL